MYFYFFFFCFCFVSINLSWIFCTRFAETGEALVKAVDKIIFVGSPGVGKQVEELCALIYDWDMFITVYIKGLT